MSTERKNGCRIRSGLSVKGWLDRQVRARSSASQNGIMTSGHAAPGTPREHRWGFPGGAVVENLPADAGDTGSSPGLGGSHMPRSGWAREPRLLSLRVWSLSSATREAATVRGPRTATKSGPRSPQLEKKPSHRNEDPTQPKNK